ncbi:MAG: hypothetical protein ACYTF5_13620 [Planctomycetota bacterium]
MARKGKDLFVLLGERLSPSSNQGSRRAAGRGTGTGIGGWFRTLFRAVSEPTSRPPRRQPRRVGPGRSAPGRSAPGRSAQGRSVNPPRVPRGLLVPGWFVIVLLLLGVTAGFVAGRWTVAWEGAPLTAKAPGNSGVAPGRFQDGDFSGRDPHLEPGYLDTKKKQEEQVSKAFFPVLDYRASQRDRAEALARYLRGQGLESTRIREVKLDSGSRWLTLCYVYDAADGRYSTDHAEECFGRLKRVQYPGFEPRFANVVQKLKSAQDGLMKFSGQ